MNQLEAMRQDLHIMRVEQRNISASEYRGRSSEINERDRNRIINSIVRHRTKNDSIDSSLDDKLFSMIQQDLIMNGVDISTNELKDYITRFYVKNSATK